MHEMFIVRTGEPAAGLLPLKWRICIKKKIMTKTTHGYYE